MKRDSTILAIASGKGGVGKSVLAVNLAETLLAEGHPTALVDVDFGQGACSVLLNESPEASLLEVVQRTAHPEATRHCTATGLTLVQGAHAPVEGSDGEALYAALDDLLSALRREHRFILIDAPAGVGESVRWALDRADLGALVLVDEPTAIADAYRLTKLVWQAEPSYPLGALVNYCDTAAEAHDVAERFGTITEHFTARTPYFLGWIPYAARLRRSVAEQTPAVRTAGPLRDAFAEIAALLAYGRHETAAPA